MMKLSKSNEKRARRKDKPSKWSALAGEFAVFLLNNKRWWLMPIIVGLIAIGLLIAQTSTSVAPPV